MPSIASSVLLGLLAVTSVAAHPRRAHFHHRRNYNGTEVLVTSTGTAYGTGLSTITSTSTLTAIQTVSLTRPGSSSAGVPAAVPSAPSAPGPKHETETSPNPDTVQNPNPGFNGDNLCKPAVHYVTETERVTVTITPGAGPSSTPSIGDYRHQNQVLPGNGASDSVDVSTVMVIPSPAPVGSTPPGTPGDVKPPPVVEVPTLTSAKTTEVVPTSTVSTQAVPTPETPSKTTSETEVVAATSKPSSKSSTPTPSSRPVTSAGKRGVVYNDPKYVNPFKGSQVSWAYNWGQLPNELNGAPLPVSLDQSFEFYPMIWSDLEVHTKNWVSNANKMIAAGSKAILGFNEPDHPAQANMDPGHAAKQFKSLITSNFAGKARLGSPGVTNGSKRPDGGAMGLSWLKEFLGLCTDCSIDFACIHWYDSAQNIEYFKKHVKEAFATTGLPIWITEFGPQGSEAEIQKFFDEIIPWLEAPEQSYVEKYSYFMAAEGTLGSTTQLNTVGAAYSS